MAAISHQAMAEPIGMKFTGSLRQRPPRSRPKRCPSMCTASASITPEIVAPARIRRRGKMVVSAMRSL